MDEKDEKEEDVDVFVSPRHFGGRTPSAKETKKKVLEEEQSKGSFGSGDSAINFDRVKYNYDSEDTESRDFVHKTVGRNNFLSKVLLVANYLLAVLGVALFAVSIWVLLEHGSPGVFSYTSRKGFILRSPIAFGLCFVAGAGGCIISGLYIGVRHVAPSLVEGLQVGNRRRYIMWYQILIGLSVAVLALALFSALPPLQRTKRIGIPGTSWRDMASTYPARICLFEIKNRCAGEKDFVCSSSDRPRTAIGCPGHYCRDTCQVTSTKPQTNKESCVGCLSQFSEAGELEKCRTSEARKSSSSACIGALVSDVERFFTVVVSASGVGIGVLLIVVVLGTLSPILNANE